jgi:hypothetical protein
MTPARWALALLCLAGPAVCTLDDMYFVRCAGSSSSSQAVLSAFRLPQIVAMTYHEMMAAVASNVVDFAILDSYLESDQLHEGGDFVQLPTVATALVPVANLPGIDPLTAPLVLTGDVLARVFSGNITFWDDAAIVAVNAGLAADGRLPHVPITVAMEVRTCRCLASVVVPCAQLTAPSRIYPAVCVLALAP